MFLPYYTFLTCATDPTARAAALASLERSWRCADGRRGRSDLWAAIYMATTMTREESDVGSMLWTLRNWPLELINWPTSNVQRLDLQYKNDGARWYKLEQKPNLRTKRVLPTNERSQYLWNANPYDTAGAPEVWNNEPARRHGGMNEDDPGAWLLPYWMARYHGLLAPANISSLEAYNLQYSQQSLKTDDDALLQQRLRGLGGSAQQQQRVIAPTAPLLEAGALWDTWGVPHIFSGTELGLCCGFGSRSRFV